jgi:hypothetical protein
MIPERVVLEERKVRFLLRQSILYIYVLQKNRYTKERGSDAFPV